MSQEISGPFQSTMCDICGRVRDPKDISILERSASGRRASYQRVTVVYCNDNFRCPQEARQRANQAY